MNVDWTKWILERLPFAMRGNRLYVLCLLLTLPVRLIYISFMEWSKRIKRKAGTNSQVCMLKKLVYDELGFSIEIEENDGKPYDFIVKTALSDVDKERQLFALLDRYKLAGKSYLYVNSQIVFTKNWETYVCERKTLFINWSKYVCEGKYRPIIRLYCTQSGTKLFVNSEIAVPRELIIRFVTGVDRPGGQPTENTPGFVFLKKGSTSASGIWEYNVSLIAAIIYNLIEPEDETYKYLIVWQ